MYISSVKVYEVPKEDNVYERVSGSEAVKGGETKGNSQIDETFFDR